MNSRMESGGRGIGNNDSLPDGLLTLREMYSNLWWCSCAVCVWLSGQPDRAGKYDWRRNRRVSVKPERRIVSENLQIKNMVKNHHLAKLISDVSWYELTRQLEYKAAWNGRKYIKIDTFYASSQLCSDCGYQNAGTKDLAVREWICPVCGAKHDRDVNAAKNILAEGLRQIA